MKKITTIDFENILGFEIEDKLRYIIDEMNLSYRDLTITERDEYILKYVDVLTNDIKKSGEHRITEWETGWYENLKNYLETDDEKDLIPKYHGKKNIVRWMGEPVLPLTENFDYKIHTVLVDCILNKYLKDCENVMEFGCGPAYHLIRIKNILSNKKLFGLDWTKASQHIINLINNKKNTNITPYNFNFFKPDFSFDFPNKSGIYTVAALEQVGSQHEEFINYLLIKKPEICVHIEPISELLNNDNLMDNLCVKYFKKRNYLDGFLTKLENLENDGIIKIIDKRRTYSGSYFIEGHSLIVWKPL